MTAKDERLRALGMIEQFLRQIEKRDVPEARDEAKIIHRIVKIRRSTLTGKAEL
jgi:hypothetical protein